MQYKIFALVAILSFLSVASVAQTTATEIPQPEFMNEINYYNQSANSLQRLEKNSAKMESKTKAMGMGGFKMGYAIENEKSPVRVTAAGEIRFVMSSGSGGMTMMDPSQMISLYKLSAKKGKREAIMNSAPGAYGMGKEKDNNKISLSFKKVKDGLYMILPDKPLERGEYSFVMMSMGSMDGSSTLYAFGVD